MFSLIYKRGFIASESFRIMVDALNAQNVEYEIVIRREIIIIFFVD